MEEQRVKRTYRLIKLIQEIKTCPCQSIEQVLKNFGISKAQFYKDKEELSSIGFEFSYDRSRHRFTITKDAFLPIESLTLSERFAIIMAVRQLSATGDYILSFEALNASRKLAAELPQSLRESMVAVFDDIVIREGFGCRQHVIEKLANAVRDNRRVILHYKRPDSEDITEEEINPYHIFFKRRALYVEGFSWNERALRMYRINRIHDVSLTAMCFTFPDDYDFGKRHKNAFSAFPGDKTEKVVVKFTKTIRPYIEESLWHHSQKIEEQRDGSILYEVHVAEPREVMWWSFHWNAEAEILEPEWLRREAAERIQAMAKKYSS